MSRRQPLAAAPSAVTEVNTLVKAQQPRPIVLADLNVDPPETDACIFPSASSSPTPLSRINVDETILEKIPSVGKDAEAMDVEASQPKKVGKCRSKPCKTEYPPECSGADADADQNNQGATSTREDKVSSLKIGLIHVARKMPKNMHAHFILGLMYQRMGQPQKAILAYEKVAENREQNGRRDGRFSGRLIPAGQAV